MNFTGPFVLICGVISAFIGGISAILMMFYGNRYKENLRPNPFKSTPAVAVLAILASLVSLPPCMLTFTQRGREIVLLERDTDGIVQWLYAMGTFALVLCLLGSFALSIFRCTSKRNISSQ